MKYANIKYYDIADGEGVRTSLFVSGCTHHCKGCFNEVAWDFNYGQDYTPEVEEEILASMKDDYIAGLTLLGGEPMEPVNQRGLISLLRRTKELYPHKTIWCYTGYTYETDLLDPSSRIRTEVTDEMLSYIDVLVDGEYVESLRDISLQFRGSSNQRILNLKEMREKEKISGVWIERKIT